MSWELLEWAAGTHAWKSAFAKLWYQDYETQITTKTAFYFLFYFQEILSVSRERGHTNTQVKCLRDKWVSNGICTAARSVNAGRPPVDLRKQAPGSTLRNVSKRRVQHDWNIRCPIIVTSQMPVAKGLGRVYTGYTWYCKRKHTTEVIQIQHVKICLSKRTQMQLMNDTSMKADLCLVYG